MRSRYRSEWRSFWPNRDSPSQADALTCVSGVARPMGSRIARIISKHFLLAMRAVLTVTAQRADVGFAVVIASRIFA